jgi:hypothetical protein
MDDDKDNAYWYRVSNKEIPKMKEDWFREFFFEDVFGKYVACKKTDAKCCKGKYPRRNRVVEKF